MADPALRKWAESSTFWNAFPFSLSVPCPSVLAQRTRRLIQDRPRALRGTRGLPYREHRAIPAGENCPHNSARGEGAPWDLSTCGCGPPPPDRPQTGRATWLTARVRNRAGILAAPSVIWDVYIWHGASGGSLPDDEPVQGIPPVEVCPLGEEGERLQHL